jgi:hypothetical protein
MSARSAASGTDRSLARSIMAACSSSTRRCPSLVVSVMIRVSASSSRIMTAGMPRLDCRIFSNERWTSRS